MSTCRRDVPITSNEVHVWHEDIRQHFSLISKYKNLLSIEEQQRSRGFAYPHLSQHYEIRRILLRLILSQYLGIEPQKIVLTTHHKGKPCLCDPNPELYFNLSYSNDHVYYIIAKHPNIGIDIERSEEHTSELQSQWRTSRMPSSA